MYSWKVDFHMKNGEIIETKVESKYNSSGDLLSKKDSNLGLCGTQDNSYNGYLSIDGKTQIVIRVGEISSVHISEFSC